MLKLVLTVLLLLIAVLLWYGSNRHQRLLRQPLARPWRHAGTLSAVLACGCAAAQLSSAATVFFCLLILMLCLLVLPFATLLRPEARHELR